MCSSYLGNDIYSGLGQLLQEADICLAISFGFEVAHHQIRAGIELTDARLQVAASTEKQKFQNDVLR